VRRKRYLSTKPGQLQSDRRTAMKTRRSPSPPPTDAASARAVRWHELDWLRLGAVGGVFVYHGTRVFMAGPYHIKNPDRLPLLDLLGFVVEQWGMPLLFLISGIAFARRQIAVKATAFEGANTSAIGAANRSKMLRAITRRLAVPFVAGTILFGPLQVYLERVQQDGFAGSFIDFLPHVFDGWYGFGGNFPWIGLHLWYLLALLIFIPASLPLIAATRALIGTRPGRRVAEILGRRPAAAVVLGGFLALWAAETIVGLWPETVGNTVLGGWALPAYFVIFLTGIAAGFLPGWRAELARRAWLLATGAVAVTAGGLLLVIAGVTDTAVAERSPFAPAYVAVMSLRAGNAWLWLLAWLALGGKILAGRPLPRALNDAVLPAYILHQPVLLVLAFFIVQLDATIAAKWQLLILNAAATTTIFAALVLFVPPLRWLFGVRRRCPIRE
jgi:glucan biosynthesis protein C